MKTMTTKALKFLKFMTMTVTACALTGCWVEPLAPKAREGLRPLSDSDVARLAAVVQSLARPENALRIATQFQAPTSPAARTVTLANSLNPSICDVSAHVTDNRWSAADVRLAADGSACPLNAEYVTIADKLGQQTDLRIRYVHQIPEDQRAVFTAEVINFAGTGTRVRQIYSGVPVPAEQVRHEFSGQGSLGSGETVTINVTTLTRQIHAKQSFEYRRRQITISVEGRDFVLFSEEGGPEGDTYRVNGAEITAPEFEDYFSSLGFIGSFSASTDAG